MTGNEYQALASRTTRSDLPADFQGAIYALGLTGEAGEVADLLKKHYGHGHPLDKDKLAKELGDTMWYISVLASHFDLSLDSIMEGNIAKLKARYPEGFSEHASINRVV